MNTANYYDQHKREYIERTQDINMNFLYDHFLPLLPLNARIVDGGCGSGRDLLYFKKNGYQVEGFDSSEEMVKAARLHSTAPVRHLCFEEIDYCNEIDGFWACASLLHLPRKKLPQIFQQIYKSLKINGILCCSFKNREDDYQTEQGVFTCFTPKELAAFVEKHTSFSTIEIFTSEDVTRKGESWTNGVFQKRS